MRRGKIGLTGSVVCTRFSTGSRSYQRFSHCCSLPLTTHHTPLTTAPVIPLVLAQKSRPSSVVPDRGPSWREEGEEVREKRAKMGTDRFLRSVPIFALPTITTNNQQPLLSSRWFSLNENSQSTMSTFLFVSIPHWFSLNAGDRKLRIHSARFHPTLVLAQKSRPSSVVPDRGRPGESEKRREERVRERRENGD